MVAFEDRRGFRGWMIAMYLKDRTERSGEKHLKKWSLWNLHNEVRSASYVMNIQYSGMCQNQQVRSHIVKVQSETQGVDTHLQQAELCMSLNDE